MDSIALPAVNDTPQAELNVPNPDVPQEQLGQEGQQTAEQQAAAQAEQERWFLEAETGTKYRTPEAAAAGIAEKDRFIAQLLAERGQAPQPVQSVPQDSGLQEEADIEALAARIEPQLARMKAFAGASPADIKAQALLDARTQYFATQDAVQRFQEQQQELSARQRDEYVVSQNPVLRQEMGIQVARRAEAEGRPPRSAQEHLDLVHLEMMRQGMPIPGMQTQAPAPAYQGVNGALAQQQQRGQIFQGSGQGTNPAPAPAIPPHLQAEADFARSRGYSEEQVQAVIKNRLGIGSN